MTEKYIINNLNDIKTKLTPDNWALVATVAVGGLTDIGFSKQGNYLLVISGAGRGLFDCVTGEKIARDYDENGEWFNCFSLECKGIGLIKDEIIHTSGLSGGGLPLSNSFGDHIELTAQNWPLYELYFCPNHQSIFTNDQKNLCIKIDSDYIRAYGFSWCGHFLVSATGSDFKLWRRL